MSTMGPVQGGNNEDLTIGREKPIKPLPTPPSEDEMTAPQSLAPKKPLPAKPLPPIEDEDGSTAEVESFGDAQGVAFDQTPPVSAKPPNPADTQFRMRNYNTPASQIQEKKSFSLTNSLKSFSTMVSNSKVGKFFSEIGPSIKASAFGTAIRGAFAKREKESIPKQLKTMLSPQSGKTLEDRFRQVFKDPSRKAELEAYCQKYDQMESFNFMERFVHFEKAPSLSAANEIRLHFVGDETPEPINVSNVPQKKDSLKKAIDDKKLMDTLPIFRECFTTLANTLYQNMQTSL